MSLLKYTDEEVELSYEEFYEDVHTEFLKFGEIVNFKVCRNGSSHLRGNVYVHYQSVDSAELAYHSMNGRYFGGKQLQCEYVGVIRWKVAICGEYMKSKLTTCSRGITCNFIHCFRNPGGDYEWADWDKPPPKYWVKKMTYLFGYSAESGCGKEVERGSPGLCRNSSRTLADDTDRYYSRRSRSREMDYSRNSITNSKHSSRRSAHWLRRRSADGKQLDFPGEEPCDKASGSRQGYCSNSDSDSERDCLDTRHQCRGSSRKLSRDCNNDKFKCQSGQCDGKNAHETSSNTYLFDNDMYNYVHNERPRKSTKQWGKRSEIRDGGGAGSNGDSSDGNSLHTAHQSGRMKSRQQKKVYSSPDDPGNRSRSYGSNSNGNWSDEERENDSSHAYDKKSARNDFEKFEVKKFFHSDRNVEDFISKDNLGMEDKEVGQAITKPGDIGRSYPSSDLNSRYQSRKDTGKIRCGESEKRFPDHIKKSKRKRDCDKRRTWDHHLERSHQSVHLVDEDLDERGRWEPDNVFLDHK